MAQGRRGVSSTLAKVDGTGVIIPKAWERLPAGLLQATRLTTCFWDSPPKLVAPGAVCSLFFTSAVAAGGVSTLWSTSRAGWGAGLGPEATSRPLLSSSGLVLGTGGVGAAAGAAAGVVKLTGVMGSDIWFLVNGNIPYFPLKANLPKFRFRVVFGSFLIAEMGRFLRGGGCIQAETLHSRFDVRPGLRQCAFFGTQFLS